MKFSYDHTALHPNRAVSSRDTMVWPGAEEQYFQLGERAIDLVQLAADLCDKPHLPKILDLPCGYGRVLRWLRAKYPASEITACDLERAGVDFCRQQFGAVGVYSEPDLRNLKFDSPFDLVWCGSLLTHLPVSSWPSTIDALLAFVVDCGILVFSTQGRFFSTLLARGEGDFAENVDTERLLEAYRRDGAAFEPYYERADGAYGLAVSSPKFLAEILQSRPDVILRAYLEEAWGIQDVVILYKRQGHHHAH